ncbi:MAG: multidrug efflux SMR transporter [Bacteroidales bacterium]|nr:multidrug efflux SMR transporter [Bacteroidales bacterium]
MDFLKTNIFWLILAIGIVFEVLAEINMKLAEGFTKLVPSIRIFVFYGIALVCLVLVLKKIEISVAYTIWAGTGTALIAIIGMYWFHESITVTKIISIVLIIIGIIGLKIFE